jgi:hypothetical protein
MANNYARRRCRSCTEHPQRLVPKPLRDPGVEGVPRDAAHRKRPVASLGELLDAGIAAGQIRPDVTAEDVMTAMNAVWTIAAEGEQWAAQALRIVRLLMDGLRFGALTDGSA